MRVGIQPHRAEHHLARTTWTNECRFADGATSGGSAIIPTSINIASDKKQIIDAIYCVGAHTHRGKSQSVPIIETIPEDTTQAPYTQTNQTE